MDQLLAARLPACQLTGGSELTGGSDPDLPVPDLPVPDNPDPESIELDNPFPHKPVPVRSDSEDPLADKISLA